MTMTMTMTMTTAHGLRPTPTQILQVPDEHELQVPAGGFKLWEGALDLCQYLIQRYGLQHLCKDSSSSSSASSAAAAGKDASSSGRDSLQGKAVIELGCGHGLPGIVAALGGASEVHFQVCLMCLPQGALLQLWKQ
jgi:hypothetical protein